MLSIGPLPAIVIVFLLALAAAIATGALVVRSHTSGTTRRLTSLIMDMTLIGLIAARLGFVLTWRSRYMDNPWSIIYISDGGFLLWTGALAALAFAVWKLRREPTLWRPLGAATCVGCLVWVGAGTALTLTQRANVSMPDAKLVRLDGGTVRLAQLSNEPMVVNLWATWCPPCRREMPMLAAAEQRHPGVTFVFVNQGQGRTAIRNYLRSENLQLTHVLLDATGAIGQSSGSGVLPTTLFYDASGRLVDTHIGMLTAASLAATLQQFDLTIASTGDKNHPETTSDT